MKQAQSFKKFVTVTVLCTAILSLYSCTSNSGAKVLNHDDSVAIFKAMAKTYQFGRPNAVWSDSVYNKGGERIHPDSAKAMIAEFTKDTAFPLQNLNGARLKGFFIKRDIFDTLINKHNASGIRLLFAKHSDGNKKAYTLVVYGTKKGAKDGEDDNDPTIGVYENIDPCPDHCGNN